jgi:hypothetical protein
VIATPVKVAGASSYNSAAKYSHSHFRVHNLGSRLIRKLFQSVDTEKGVSRSFLFVFESGSRELYTRLIHIGGPESLTKTPILRLCASPEEGSRLTPREAVGPLTLVTALPLSRSFPPASSSQSASKTHNEL